MTICRWEIDSHLILHPFICPVIDQEFYKVTVAIKRRNLKDNKTNSQVNHGYHQ